MNRYPKLKTAALSILILCLCVGFLVFALRTFIAPNHDYKEAVHLYNSGDYAGAKEAFESLGNYRKSREYIQDCINAENLIAYSKAEGLYSAGRYEEALLLYQGLLDYSDAATKSEKCEEAINMKTYDIGVEKLNSGAYDEALEVFLSLGDYKDCSELIQRCEQAIDDSKTEKVQNSDIPADQSLSNSNPSDNSSTQHKSNLDWVATDANLNDRISVFYTIKMRDDYSHRRYRFELDYEKMTFSGSIQTYKNEWSRLEGGRIVGRYLRDSSIEWIDEAQTSGNMKIGGSEYSFDVVDNTLSISLISGSDSDNLVGSYTLAH